MARERQSGDKQEPIGFGEHTRGLSGEYAHEQGWGLDEEQRKQSPSTPQDTDGGGDYNYGARDFGDSPSNMSRELTETPPEELVDEGPGRRALRINLHSNKENR